jgi:sugar phosphate isomerase/epimerase
MKGFGFDGIEVMIGDPDLFDRDVFGKSVLAHGLEVSQLCTGELFGSLNLMLNDPDGSARKAALKKAESVVRLAGSLGCKVGIGRFRGKIWNGDEMSSLEALAGSLSALDRFAGEEGVELLIEPLRPDICDTLTTVSQACTFMDAAGLSNFGWLLDTDHVGLDQEQSIVDYKDRLGFVHLADTFHVPIGRGKIDFPRYIELLGRLEYAGYFSVEVFGDKKMGESVFLAEMAEKLEDYISHNNREGKV